MSGRRPERPASLADPQAIGPGGVLALDLSSVTGWAYGGVLDDRPAFGTWHLPVHLGMGAAYTALENELADAIADLQPAEVIMEAPLGEAMKAVGEGFRNEAAARQQLVLAGLVESTCYRETVICREAHVGKVRAAVLGSGRIPKGQAKATVLKYCATRGWPILDHNAADAAVLWAYRTGELRLRGRVAA